MTLTPIHRVQGPGDLSPMSGETVRVRGVVIGRTRRAFFVQDPHGRSQSAASDGVCIFAPRAKVPKGALVDVTGRVVDYRTEDHEHPLTQVVAANIDVIDRKGPDLEPVWLTAELLDTSATEVARRLNSLEAMLVGIPAGATLLAPSNPYGDYVALPPDWDRPRTRHHGVRIDPDEPLRWYPSFRLLDYDAAPRVDVGATLIDPVVGPLHYRASSYQIAAREIPRVHAAPPLAADSLPPARDSQLSILTLNGFNLDPKVERPDRVADPRRDIDDDIGDGRYDMLGRVIAHDAAAPDLVALQEIQDDDGAEISENVCARENYRILIAAVTRAGGPSYRWVDRPPIAGADGGQPGGNIRNAFLYRPDRVTLVEPSVRRLGETDPAFEESRKPLLAHFEHNQSGRRLAVVNVHLASKRHQHSIFAVEDPGLDSREHMRINQCAFIAAELDSLEEQGLDTYTTGDFNDYEFSLSLRRLCAGRRINLVERVLEDERYDYNHRGALQSLMHGLVSPRLAPPRMAEYRVLHGNELSGVAPGTMGTRATDHAYVLARLEMG